MPGWHARTGNIHTGNVSFQFPSTAQAWPQPVQKGRSCTLFNAHFILTVRVEICYSWLFDTTHEIFQITIGSESEISPSFLELLPSEEHLWYMFPGQFKWVGQKRNEVIADHLALTQLVLFLKQVSPFRGLHCSGVLKVHFCKSPGDPAVHATVGKIHQHYQWNVQYTHIALCRILWNLSNWGKCPFVRCPHFRHEMVIHYDGVNSIMKIIPARNTQHRLFPRICVIHDLPFVFLFHTYCNCTLCHTCCTSGYISVLAVAHNLLSPLLVDAALTVGLLGIQGLYT